LAIKKTSFKKGEILKTKTKYHRCKNCKDSKKIVCGHCMKNSESRFVEKSMNLLPAQLEERRF